MADRSTDDHHARLAAAHAKTGLQIFELWLAYFALGGSAGSYEIDAYLAGLMPMSAHEHNVLAHAVNERLVELSTPPEAPYGDWEL